MISDDSGSESSEGTRSGRARRLRRALSRTPGALPRRTVVSERAPRPQRRLRSGRADPRPSARPCVSASPPPAGWRRTTAGASRLTACRPRASRRARTGAAWPPGVEFKPERPGAGEGRPSTWATSHRPPARAVGFPELRRGWGRGSRDPGLRGAAPDLEAGARERVIVWLEVGADVCREVAGGRRAGTAGLGRRAALQAWQPRKGPACERPCRSRAGGDSCRSANVQPRPERERGGTPGSASLPRSPSSLSFPETVNKASCGPCFSGTVHMYLLDPSCGPGVLGEGTP